MICSLRRIGAVARDRRGHPRYAADHIYTRGVGTTVHAGVIRFASSGDRTGGGAGGAPPHELFLDERDELPYKVEVWDDAKTAVDQTLAVTASPSIGYAAYYAATREFPNRYITLRHRTSIISRWNGPPH